MAVGVDARDQNKADLRDRKFERGAWKPKGNDMEADVIDDFKTLHTNAIDARHGYEEALHDAEGRGMTPLFRDMIALHNTNADELADVLIRGGAAADESGSFMSAVHRTVISIRALFGGLDSSVLPGLIDGETRNVKRYEKALDQPALDPANRALLETQRRRLDDAIIRMESLERKFERT